MRNPDMFLACSCSLMHDIKPHAPLTFHGTWVYSDTELDTIFSWAIMYSNCNTFFQLSILSWGNQMRSVPRMTIGKWKVTRKAHRKYEKKSIVIKICFMIKHSVINKLSNSKQQEANSHLLNFLTFSKLRFETFLQDFNLLSYFDQYEVIN